MKPEFSLLSPETGTDYWIYLERPVAAGGELGPWPLVLIMDGDDQFLKAVAEYRALEAAGAVRPLLLVGVGYGASYRQAQNRRGRDYTPVAHHDEPASGGADAFLKFLTATLWPELRRRYRVDETVRGVAGHSLGSLLVLHGLFQPAPFFTHHLASAPSIWWAERAIFGVVEKLQFRQPELRAKLFLSIGEEDSESMVTDLTLLEEQLEARSFLGLAVVSKRFPQRNHFNVLSDAFAEGFRSLFGTGSK